MDFRSSLLFSVYSLQFTISMKKDELQVGSEFTIHDLPAHKRGAKYLEY
jgi:hypothetical protein